ncbi:hypothetical protein PIB30_017845 [Stylosanthes scabra]|uniref:Uncharacterized protein n=1 Tax=Stylosanthes scabra TaxID=79078 RepID=A0ABU6W8Q1_9FABA|nr:hypothetical protein [Stylosanthes scabra]
MMYLTEPNSRVLVNVSHSTVNTTAFETNHGANTGGGRGRFGADNVRGGGKGQVVKVAKVLEEELSSFAPIVENKVTWWILVTETSSVNTVVTMLHQLFKFERVPEKSNNIWSENPQHMDSQYG